MKLHIYFVLMMLEMAAEEKKPGFLPSFFFYKILCSVCLKNLIILGNIRRKFDSSGQNCVCFCVCVCLYIYKHFAMYGAGSVVLL